MTRDQLSPLEVEARFDALRGRSLAVYLPDLSGGGTERLHLGLAPYFQRAGLTVTFWLNKRKGDLVGTCDVPIVSLETERQISGFPRLVSELNRHKPDFLIANMEHMNVTALLAKKVARVRTRIFACQHNTLSKQADKPGLKNRTLPWLYRTMLPSADGVVAVSHGVADDLRATAHITQPITVIHNGVVTDDFDQRSSAPVAFPWLSGEGPLLVAVGRMVPQKDYRTLLRAFAIVAHQRPARLAILGDGPLRGELESLTRELGIADRVVMPGFIDNPLAVMSRSRMLVMSSQFEGFGLVIAEALACGLPVVSTDCPHGPAEILENGAFGTLTPVGNAEALADAILEALDRPADEAFLKSRGRTFTLARCATQYLDLLRQALRDSPSRHATKLEPAS